MNRESDQTISIVLQPKQLAWLQMFERGVRHPAFGGAMGGGKSYAARKILLCMLMKHEGTNGLLIRREYKKVFANHILPLLTEHPIIGKEGWFNKTDGIVYLPNNSKLFFGHSEHELDILNHQGIEYDYIIVEEGTEFTEFQWDFLNTRCRTSKPGVVPVMGLSCNPGGVGHTWVKRRWIDRQFDGAEEPSDYEFIQSKVYDNPALMSVDLKYVKALQNMKDPQLRKAYLDGNWDIYPNQFFDCWSREKIEVEPFEIPSGWTLLGGLDHGESAPTSFALNAIDYDGKVFRLFEHYLAGQHASVHAEQISAKIKQFSYTGGRKPAITLADPSMWTKRKVDERRAIAPVDSYRGKLFLVPANNNRVNGWMACRKLITEEKYFTFKGFCPNVHRTVPGLPRDKNNVEDIDTRAEDHAADDMRYVCSHLVKPSFSTPAVQESEFAGSVVLSEVRAQMRSGYRYGRVVY